METSAFRPPIFEDRPYGGRLKLDNSTTIIAIAPHMNTVAGVDKRSLNKNGLRGHENESKEHITFLRFADSVADDHSTPLVYKFEDQEGQVKEKLFGVGAEFYSVDNNGKTGFWHVIENVSDRPIMLMIKVAPKTAELRT